MVKSQVHDTTLDSIQKNVPDTKVGHVLDSILLSLDSTNKKIEAAQLSRNLSVSFYYQKAYKEAIKYGLEEVNRYEELQLQNNIYLNGLYQLALFYQKDNNSKNAIQTYNKIIDLDIDSLISGRSYRAIARHLRKSNDYYLAIEYYEKAERYFINLDKKKILFGIYIDLGIIYQKINSKNSLQSKFKILQTLEKLRANITLRNKQYYMLNNSWFRYYSNEKVYDFKKAKFHIENILNRSLLEADTSIISLAYLNKGYLYEKENKDSTLFFVKKSRQYGVNKINIAKSYRVQSDFYFKKEEYSKALDNIHLALVNNTELGEGLNLIPTKTTLNKVSDKYQVLSCLTQKSTILIQLYKQNNDKAYIKQALDNLLAADTLVSLIEEESSDTSSKLFWRKEASWVYIKAILCSEILGEDELAFSFSEKNKALLLTKGIQDHANTQKLPEDLVLKEHVLQKEILELEYKLSSIHNDSIESQRTIQNKLFDTRNLQQKLLDSIKQAFPEYYDQRDKSQVISVEKIQEQLDEDTAVISYLWNKELGEYDKLYGLDALYGTLVTKDRIKVFKIEDLKASNALVSKFRTLVSKPFETEADRDVFNQAAFALYNKLFPHNEVQKHIEGKRLIIIPDNDLQYLPFEALLTDINQPRYLIESHEMQYAYSMSFLLQNKRVQREAENDFIAFSPSTFSDNSLQPLLYTESEVIGIQNTIGGMVIQGTGATKQDFISSSNVYRILHLATHADAGDAPWIAFNDAKLNLHELYTLKTQADMVVLSACNTSLGEQVQGEGALSLARGFFYSGSGSVVSTLWNTSDVSTSYIMKDFYTHLKKGDSKSKALQKAKLNYIQNHSLSDTSPYYWASAIVIGDTQPVFDRTNTYLILLGVLLTLISVTFFFRRKRATH